MNSKIPSLAVIAAAAFGACSCGKSAQPAPVKRASTTMTLREDGVIVGNDGRPMTPDEIRGAQQGALAQRTAPKPKKGWFGRYLDWRREKLNDPAYMARLSAFAAGMAAAGQTYTRTANSSLPTGVRGYGARSYNSQRIGNVVFHSDGTSSQRIGNTWFHSDGSSTQRIGNTLFNSDGSSSQRIGNTWFHSGGASSQRIGNTWFHSDGTSTTRIGNTLYTQ